MPTEKIQGRVFNMSQLYDMDKRIILESIENVKETTMDFDRYNMLGLKIENDIQLTNFEIDFITLLVKHNNQLRNRYKNLLIEIINEGGE